MKGKLQTLITEQDVSPEIHLVKENIELIEGEVYVNEMGTIFIYKGLSKYDSYNIYVAYNTKNGLMFNHITKTSSVLATLEHRDQLFSELSKNNKHFDNENLRLLDIEEWTCKNGHPYISRTLNDSDFTEWFCTTFDGENDLNYEDDYINIPYNEITKSLIGTTDLPQKHYIFKYEKYEF